MSYNEAADGENARCGFRTLIMEHIEKYNGSGDRKIEVDLEICLALSQLLYEAIKNEINLRECMVRIHKNPGWPGGSE